MRFSYINLTLLLFLLLQACNFPVTFNPTATPTIAHPTIIPPTTHIPVPTSPAILHTLIPASMPSTQTRAAADQDSSRTARQKTAGGGDFFQRGEYERPFNAFTMDIYFPELDILRYDIFQDETWIFASITLRSLSSEGKLSGQYALEIDNDIDGRGDWLIVVTRPASTTWSVEGVQVWQDINNDVGGSEPVRMDKVPSFGDGYETKIFDSGIGIDADAAWARISPENQLVVQIAVKAALVDDDGKYLAGVWAARTLDPAMFDFNDRMTAEQAGAAVQSFAYYPIKGLAELDQACRVAINVVAKGENLGLCQAPPPPQTGRDAPPQGCQPQQCPSGWGWDPTTCSCVLLPPP